MRGLFRIAAVWALPGAPDATPRTRGTPASPRSRARARLWKLPERFQFGNKSFLAQHFSRQKNGGSRVLDFTFNNRWVLIGAFLLHWNSSELIARQLLFYSYNQADLQRSRCRNCAVVCFSKCSCSIDHYIYVYKYV